MNKTTSRVIMLVVVVALGVGLFFALDSDEPVGTDQAQNQQTETESNEVTENDGENQTESEETADAVVIYTNDGFSPEDIGPIEAGDTVRFVNESTRSMWVASDQHPAHTDYPAFDQLQGVGAGQSYSFTFNESGEYDFHNHLAPSDGGTVIVE